MSSTRAGTSGKHRKLSWASAKRIPSLYARKSGLCFASGAAGQEWWP